MPACMSVCMPAYVCVSVGSRELFAEGSAVQEKKQALATLSSAKLALQGVVTKTKVRGVMDVGQSLAVIFVAEFWCGQ